MQKLKPAALVVVLLTLVGSLALATLVPTGGLGGPTQGMTGGYRWGMGYVNVTHPEPTVPPGPPVPLNERASEVHFSSMFSEVQYDNAFPKHHPYCPPIETIIIVTYTRLQPPPAPPIVGSYSPSVPAMSRNPFGLSQGAGSIPIPHAVPGVAGGYQDGDLVFVFLLVRDACRVFLTETASFVWRN